jgi:hypothetical protein
MFVGWIVMLGGAITVKMVKLLTAPKLAVA